MSIALESTVGSLADRDAARLARVEWCLRIGAAMCFIGHGAFGIITKESWLPYFAVAGIGRDLALQLMPIVGTVDIASGIIVLLSPRPIILLYMSIWGMWTALLRPLAGESFFEMLERAGNYGLPIALLVMFSLGGGLSGLFKRAQRRPVIHRDTMGRVLLWSTAVLLFAHGALQTITHKPLFDTLYAAIGVSGAAAPMIGSVEMAIAVLVLIAPVPALLIAIAAWKVASETLFPLSGTPIWEFIERGGSYLAPLALVLLSGTSPFTRITFSRSNR